MTTRHSRLRGIQLAAAVSAALLALTGCNDNGSAGDNDAGAQHKGQDKGQDKAPGGESSAPSPSATASSGASSAPSSPGTGSTASATPAASAAPTASAAASGKSPSGARWTSNDKRVKVLKCADPVSTTVFVDNTDSSGADLPLTIKVRIVSQTGEEIETDKGFVAASAGETATKTIEMGAINRASEVALCEVKASVY
ncbi:hypothetical protein AB0D04_21785 [Streptomyces sp. NPDC048483]|uniref:hypothetical protein n=1 Tax=Streptomyces sp. NPDC048483 TaxID=3154927 RepID=UPI003439E4B5